MSVPSNRRSLTDTATLLGRARAGDRAALDALFGRYGPELTRFAHGRLPRWARDLTDTPDLVQETLLHTFRHLAQFQWRGEGALRAYTRQAVMNRIRDELRRHSRHPHREELPEDIRHTGPTSLDSVIAQERVDRYERALAQLKESDRDLIVARFELGLSYAEIAESSGRESANAARMAVARALVRLTVLMEDAATPDRAT
jgi:RNA polymerase sigma factor (sigma-70 family)